MAEIFKSCFCVTSLTDSAKAISEGASLKYISPMQTIGRTFCMLGINMNLQTGG